MFFMLLSPEKKETILRQLKGLGIRLGFVLLSTGAAYVAANLGVFDLEPSIAVVIGAVLGEISEWAEAHYKVANKVAGYFGGGKHR